MQNGFNVNKRQHEKLIRNKKKFKLNKEKKSRNTLRDAKKNKTETHNNTFCKNRRNVSKTPENLYEYFWPK